MDEAPIRVRGLEKRFGRQHVLAGVDLEVPRGSVCGLLGRNGAGKSTLLRLLVGLSAPDCGTVDILGEDPRRLSVASAARIGYVAQRCMFPPWMSVRMLIQHVASIRACWDHDLVESLMLEWQVQSRQRLGVLSQGQRQKLAIILAAGHRPDVLILDEPAAGMDPLGRRRFVEFLIQLASERSVTVLFSTHLSSDLERAADRIAILTQGRIAYAGELAALTESITRYRVCGLRLPDAVPGAITYDRTEGAALLTLRGDAAPVLAELRSQGCTVDALGSPVLEDIFVETMR